MTIQAPVATAVDRGVATRWLTLLALWTGAAAAVLLLVAARSGGDGDSDGVDADWILGLLVILAPLLCATATRSVAASRLLRPVGGSATFVCLLASAAHAALAVGRQGTLGWIYAIPALATPVLLLAAVVRGPASRHGESQAFDSQPGSASAGAAHETEILDGPPLDVSSPLRDARNHATKSVLAWLVVLGILAVFAVPLFRALGWPTVVASLDARVVDVHDIGEDTAVTFEAQDHGRTLRWAYVWDDPEWEVGDRRVTWIDAEGDVHLDQQFGLAGTPLLMPLLLVGVFAVFAHRRMSGLMVASFDLHHSHDPPRLGYAAVIIDPAPRTWRPLLAVWDHDPTSHPRLAKPDAVYRADDETGQNLQTPAWRVAIRRAWIDTGRWDRSKPRWVGVEDGVAVPHRRSFLGRWYVHQLTRRSEVGTVAALRHGPPDPRTQALAPPRTGTPHRLVAMIAWRLLALAAGMALSFLIDDAGRPADVDETLSMQALKTRSGPATTSRRADAVVHRRIEG